MRISHYIIAVLLLLTLLACSAEKKEPSSGQKPVQAPLNPNGDSELALLMRAMFDEAEQIKKEIAKGQPITTNIKHEEILTAHATQPEKVASDEYKAFANSYLQSMTVLQTSNSAQQSEHFEDLVDKCLACHQEICPGPMVKIKKLRQSQAPIN